MKTVVFKDRVKIFVRAGNGGNGIVAFRREKFAPQGGPDGGDGGNGGSILLRGDINEDSLHPLHYHPHQRAEHGENGRGGNRTGRSGKNNILRIPCGTVILDAETENFVAEILKDGQKLIIAKGGHGGIGNFHFKSSVNQAPSQCTFGTLGEERAYRLELKLLADVGLVGYPNAGKSTLLTELTEAHPKIAAYPFTTINPIIGTLIYENYSRIRIADIPGLINGASDGVGLGHHFLRHIERSHFLLFVLDMAAEDGRNPIEDYRNLCEELRSYNSKLLTRPRLILANKMDMSNAVENLKTFRSKTELDPLPISAGLGEGIDPLKDILYEQFFGK